MSYFVKTEVIIQLEDTEETRRSNNDFKFQIGFFCVTTEGEERGEKRREMGTRKKWISISYKR